MVEADERLIKFVQLIQEMKLEDPEEIYQWGLFHGLDSHTINKSIQYIMYELNKDRLVNIEKEIKKSNKLNKKDKLPRHLRNIKFTSKHTKKKHMNYWNKKLGDLFPKVFSDALFDLGAKKKYTDSEHFKKIQRERKCSLGTKVPSTVSNPTSPESYNTIPNIIYTPEDYSCKQEIHIELLRMNESVNPYWMIREDDSIIDYPEALEELEFDM